jgi:hypothetical protein
VDIGHVWPQYFREHSEQAKHQQILLCKNCNSKAGRAGDEIMQADAQIRKGEKTGDLGLRKLRVTVPRGHREALDLEAFVQESGERSLQLSFPKYRKPSQRRYFGEQRKRLYQYAAEGPVNITVYPPRGKPSKPFGDPTNDPLVQAGFLTSAYLLAFYQYGYRYILQTCLEPVRAYIKDSFNKKVDNRLDFQETKDTCVRICFEPTHFCSDPEISLVIPSIEEIPFHQEVRFLNYHIRLPVPPIFVGIDRQNLMLQFLGADELPSEGGRELHSLGCSSMFASNLDHPILAKLQELK